MEDDTRDRVIALEVNVSNLEKQIDHMNELLTEIHSFLQQAKGARWALSVMVLVGGFLAGLAARFLPIFGGR